MKCPICDTKSTVVKTVGNIEMCECLDCKCIFTYQDITDICIDDRTDGNNRNHRDINLVRLDRVKACNKEVKDILDFGCGNWYLVNLMNEQGLNCLGVDLDTNLKLSDIEDNSLDLVFMIEVIEHIIDPKPIISEFRRILKPDGLIYLESSFTDFLHLHSSYIDPKIGHVLVHSEKSLLKVFDKETYKKLTRNVYIFKVEKE